MRLLLIRHGKTSYNIKKRYCGSTDIGLSRIGRLESEKLREKLKGLKIDKIYCSDLKRSVQTARLIFKGRKLKLIKVKKLREINFGAWEGKTYDHLIKKHPVYKRWLRDPFKIDIPSGESMKHFVARVKMALKDIVKKNRLKTIAIVSHFGTMRVILNGALKLKRRDFWSIKLNPETIYILESCKFTSMPAGDCRDGSPFRAQPPEVASTKRVDRQAGPAGIV